MDSIWRKTETLPEFPPLMGDAKTDILIIGGGMAGLLCAYFLQQAGLDYLLVEANRIGQGVTQNTTAKLTFQHGLIYHKLVNEFGIDYAQLYLQANINALQMYRKMCKSIDCDFESKDSFVYAQTNRAVLEKELQTLEHLGYHPEYVSAVPLPLPTVGAIKFPNQAQFHPFKFLKAITPSLKIHEQTKVLEMAPHFVKTNHSQISAKNIIVATHYPILNKHGSYFLKLYQSRSYVLALENAQNVNGMYVDENDKGLSFRNADELLLLGGGSHRTGKDGGKWHELLAFAQQYYPGAPVRYQWATQDCMSLDAVPYIGLYGKHTENLYVTGGFNKWGMTTSMVSALMLRDFILEKKNPYATVFSPHRTLLRPQLFVNTLESAKHLLTPTRKRCPHMGCALKWNETEQSWDCPCHGSRFTKEGTLIENPATDDLPS